MITVKANEVINDFIIRENITSKQSTSIVPDSTSIQQPTIAEVIEFLLDLGLSPLPVAPAQDASKYPKRKVGEIIRDKDGNPLPLFTGKNPSYLDAQGKPHIISWTAYQDKQPTRAELSIWFKDPSVGIGALFNPHICAIDIDRKNFDSDEQCNQVLENLIGSHPGLEQTHLEQTHSGGYRLIVELEEPVTFRNMSLTPGGKHHGEIISNGFAVLAPTVGVSGNQYKLLGNFGKVVKFKNAEAGGVYPTGITKIQKPSQAAVLVQQLDFTSNTFNTLPDGGVAIPFSAVCALWLKDLLDGKQQEIEDRSKIIIKAVREIRGWQNWLSKINAVIEESESYIIQRVGHLLSIEYDRILRIAKTVTDSNCQPGLFWHGGEAALWKKLYFANKELHNQHCPIEHRYVVTDNYEKTIELSLSDGSKLPIRVYGSSNKWELWKKTKVYTNPDITVCVKYLTLSDHVDEIWGKLIAVKSGMGTGKSQNNIRLIGDRLAEVVDGMTEAKLSNKGSIVVTPRQQLNKNFASSLMTALAERDEANGTELFRGHRFKIIESKVTREDIDRMLSEDTIICCAESLHRINDHIQGKLVIFDEWNTIIEQAISHKTSDKMHIFESFKQIGLQAYAVVLCDANLSDRTVDFGVKCFGETKKLLKVLNPYQNTFNFIHCLPVEDMEDLSTLSTRDRSAAMKGLLDLVEKGKVFSTSDSKKLLESYEIYLRVEGKGSFLLSADTKDETWREWLNNKTLPSDIQKRFLDDIVTQYSNPEEFLNKVWTDEFLGNPDSFLEKYAPYYEVFFQSPSGSTGISIVNRNGIIKSSIDYKLGVLSIDESTQMVCRLRNDFYQAERHIYYSDKAHIPGKIYSSMEEYNELVEEYTHTLIHYGASSLSEARSEAKKIAEQTIKNYVWYDFAEDSKFWQEYEKTNYGACYTYSLVSQGHNITERLVEVDPVAKKNLKNVREAMKCDEANLIHIAKPLTDQEKEFYKDKSSKDIRARKLVTYKEKLYPGILDHSTWTPAIIERFHGSKSSETDRIIRNSMMWNYPELATKRQEWFDYFSVATNSPSERTAINEDIAKLIILRELVQDVLETDGSWNVEAFIAKVKKQKPAIRKILNAPQLREWADPKKVAKWINELYKFLGLSVNLKTEEETEHWNFLLDCAKKQYHDFEKEGKFMSSEAWEHSLKEPGHKHPDFQEKPKSLQNGHSEEDIQATVSQPKVDPEKHKKYQEYQQVIKEVTEEVIEAYTKENDSLLEGIVQRLSYGDYIGVCDEITTIMMRTYKDYESHVKALKEKLFSLYNNIGVDRELLDF